MNLKAFIANLAWFLYSAMKTWTWKRARSNVEKVQSEILKRILSQNAATSFGKRHSFSDIDSVAAFQKSVPIRSYDSMQELIEEIAGGVPRVLTLEPVKRFGVTSGSTAATKLIPYTASLVREFQKGIDPWMYHLMMSYPRLLFGKAYWSITPVGVHEKKTRGGIPIGFDDDKLYFGWFTQKILETIMASPSELALVQDMDAFRYATLRFLLQEKSLAFVSIWNPTFISLLLSPLPKWYNQLVEDVRTGGMSIDLGVTPEIDARIRKGLKKSSRRAQELAKIRTENGAYSYEKIWPNLKVMSSWAHGNARGAIPHIQSQFPSITIQPKGLVATEAFVSFPLHGEASALSITSHFFEFEEEGGEIRLAHEIKMGMRYTVIVTTSGGLYRYRLNDIIEVIGFEKECPLIKFIGRQDKVVDIVGEKLNEQFASDVVNKILANHGMKPSFWMLAPSRSETGVAYTLFAQFGESVSEDSLRSAAREIDTRFRENFHYDYCRRLGQLGPCTIFLIDEDHRAQETYLSTCRELGQRLGDIKSVALHPHQKWSEKFAGTFV
jgi:hypothetical protein